MPLFGTSGIRALANESLFSMAFQVGVATGTLHRDVVIARDTRDSGPQMRQALVSGLLAADGRCTDAGIVPTPTLAHLTRNHACGIMITASHNPPEYNGLKLWNPDGSSFEGAQQAQLEAMLAGDDLPAAGATTSGSCQEQENAAAGHITRILQDFPERLDIKVVVDSGGGAATGVTSALLERMGCQVITIHGEPTGAFPRPSEPLPENLGLLMKTTLEEGAGLGIAHDGDADRMMAVDERGRFVSGDALLTIFAGALGAREVVTTVDASMALEEMGFRVRRTAVGDTQVSAALRAGGDFGGEASGSWVFPAVSLCPDGIYAAALIAAISAGGRLSALVDKFPAYPLLRGSLSLDGTDLTTVEKRLLALSPVSTDTTDGLKLAFSDGWVLVRASGTESKIRLTAEATTQTRARQLYQDCVAAIEGSRQGVLG